MGNDHQHALPELAPYPGQVERALRLVHVRRRRALAVAASAAALVVVASMLLSARGGGLTMLGPVRPAVGTDLPPERAARADARRTAPPARPPVPAGPEGHAAHRAPDDSAAATAPRAAAAAEPPVPARETPPRTPILRKQERDPAACVHLTDWCRGAAVSPGETIELHAHVCRPAVREPVRLRFATEQEVEFVVSSADTGEEVWRWSTRAPDYRPHAVTVEGGSCVSWTTPWARIGDDGRRLPPGDYVLHVTLLSQQPMALPSVRWQAA